MKRILLAFDGSEPAKRAVSEAADLAAAMDASITVVTVIPVGPDRAPIPPWDDRDYHTPEIVEAQSLLAARGITAELLERPGDAAQTIEQLADEGDFDVIVLGSRGLGTVERVLQGSVSSHVATHAHKTVVIVH